MSDTDETHWHLDRRVPLALIFALVMQSGSFAWWASSISERVAQNERSGQRMGGRMQRVELLLSEQASQDAVLVEQIRNVNESVRVVREEVRSTNTLLRELLNTLAEQTKR